MPLENSPKIQPRLPITFDLRAWVRRHRRILFGAGMVLLALNLGVLALRATPTITALPPGGVDGCIKSANQQPVSATIWADTLTRRTFSDGCFFFAQLAPGEHTLRVVTDGGAEWAQPVTIKSGQAVGLGNVYVPGR